MVVTDTSRRDRRAASEFTGAPSASIPVVPFGLALSLFLAITYAACVVYYLIFPEAVLGHALLALLLPGFKLLSWSSFALGLIESYAYGWYVALVFGPLYNFFVVWGVRPATSASAGE
jgi:hypothetical protein